jgi:hypothetical protein
MAQIYAIVAIIILSVVSAFSQAPADHSGKWTLDVSASKLEERSRVESMTMSVTQSKTEITVETATKRAAPPEGAGAGRGGGMGRGGFGGGDSKTTYSLEGKETTFQQETPMGSIPVKLIAKAEPAKLTLTQTRTMSGQMGEITITTKEVWTLSDEGKTLTIKRDSTNPRGSTSSTLVFTKS